MQQRVLIQDLETQRNIAMADIEPKITQNQYAMKLLKHCRDWRQGAEDNFLRQKVVQHEEEEEEEEDDDDEGKM